MEEILLFIALEAIIVVAVVAAIVVAFVIAHYLRRYRDSKKSNRQASEPMPEERSLSVPNYEGLREKALKKDFWTDAYTSMYQHIRWRDYFSLEELVYKVWSSQDKVANSLELHLFLSGAVRYLHQSEDKSDTVVSLIMRICELDISNYCNMNPLSVDYRVPQRYTIILERKEMYEEAIEVCEYCTSLGIKDGKDKSFELRRDRLFKKLKGAH